MSIHTARKTLLPVSKLSLGLFGLFCLVSQAYGACGPDLSGILRDIAVLQESLGIRSSAQGQAASTAAVEAEVSCAICQDDVSSSQVTTIEHCGHKFCDQCIIEHHDSTGPTRNQCPLCRVELQGVDLQNIGLLGKRLPYVPGRLNRLVVAHRAVAASTNNNATALRLLATNHEDLAQLSSERNNRRRQEIEELSEKYQSCIDSMKAFDVDLGQAIEGVQQRIDLEVDSHHALVEKVNEIVRYNNEQIPLLKNRIADCENMGSQQKDLMEQFLQFKAAQEAKNAEFSSALSAIQAQQVALGHKLTSFGNRSRSRTPRGALLKPSPVASANKEN